MLQKMPVNIFFASSGELNEERAQSYIIAAELNKKFPHLFIDPILFELDTPSGNNPGLKRIQDSINPLLDKSDIVVVLFYSKVGDFTKEEFDRAIEQDKKVFLYLKKGFQSSDPQKIKVFLELAELRVEIEEKSSIRYVLFDDVKDYHNLIREDLELYLTNKFPAPTSIKSLVDIDIESSYDVIENKLNTFPKPKPYFTGRETELDEFKTAIENEINFITIDGPGGIGKTQFISKAIELFIPSEKVIWFVCTAVSQLDTLISEAGYPELLKGSNKSDREKFSAFKDKIQENEFYLFLDNYQETNSNPIFKDFLVFIQEFLKKGCVIVIDRDDIRSAILDPKRIAIKGFQENKLKYAKALIAYSFQEVIIQDFELEKLCDELKGYPFVIYLAVLLLSEGVTPVNIIANIVQDDDTGRNSERLLNAIFSRPDATQEEKDFIRQFSVFTGSVPANVVKNIISPELVNAAKLLQKKNLLSYTDDKYEIHPLVREFCYKELTDKENIHANVANYYISQRTTELSPSLEEQIFYHLAQSRQWERIEKEIEDKGRQFIRFGQLGLVLELLDKLKELGIDKPIFNILYGDIAEIQGKWDEAKTHFDNSIRNATDKKIKAEGIIKYGEMLFRLGQSNEALPIFEEAYRFSSANNFLKEEGRAVNGLGLIYQTFGNLDSAYNEFNKGLQIRIKIEDKEGIANSLTNIGYNYEVRGDLAKAIQANEESLKIHTEIKNLSGMANSLNHIANIDARNGKLEDGLIKAKKSLSISNISGDKVNIANSLNVIGSIHKSKGKFDIALSKFQESLEISQTIGFKTGVGISSANIGDVYYETKKYDDALTAYENFLNIALEVGDKSSISKAINNIGYTLSIQGKTDEAILHLSKSLKLSEEIGDILNTAIILNNIGSFYIEKPDPNYLLAIEYLLKSYSIYIGIKDYDRSQLPKSWLIKIRDKLIGLEQFKKTTIDVLKNLDDVVQANIPLNELFKEPIHRETKKIGRNDPCHCGSGKKFKNCHGLIN